MKFDNLTASNAVVLYRRITKDKTNIGYAIPGNNNIAQ